jgi:hypothetical protein
MIRYPDDFHLPTLAEMQEAIALTEVTRSFIKIKNLRGFVKE